MSAVGRVLSSALRPATTAYCNTPDLGCAATVRSSRFELGLCAEHSQKSSDVACQVEFRLRHMTLATPRALAHCGIAKTALAPPFYKPSDANAFYTRICINMTVNRPPQRDKALSLLKRDDIPVAVVAPGDQIRTRTASGHASALRVEKVALRIVLANLAGSAEVGKCVH